MASSTNPFVDALMAKQVEASVVDFDHYRLRGGLSVETDYIISVRHKEGEVFDDFKISKTYSAFRTYASQLKKASTKQLDSSKRDTDELGADARALLQFAESVSHLIDSQRTQYIGKVNYSYVKGLAQQRSQIIDDVLDLTLANFPDKNQQPSPAAKEVAQAIETFFLTDHVEAIEQEDEEGTNVSSENETVTESRPSKLLHVRGNSGDSNSLLNEAKKFFTPSKKKHHPVPASLPLCSPVVPLTRKQRRSISCRSQDDLDLREFGDSAKLLLDDDRGDDMMLSPNYAQPVPTVHFARNTTTSVRYNWLADLIEYNPWIFLAIFVASTFMVRAAGMLTVTIDVDVALLFLFASFCIGLHMPRPSQSGIDTPAVAPKPKVAFEGARNRRKLFKRNSSLLIRRSMLISPKATPANARSSTLTMDEASNNSHTRQVMELTSVENEVFDGEEAEDPLIQSPMPMFPPDAELGSILNRWSAPPAPGFHVRGSNYLQDRKKVESQEFLFPVRGVDLFLTDTCPENVGRNSGVMGGQLRDVATFIVNYRLPWGVLLFYFEIPERFHPFVRKGFDPLFGENEKLPDLDSMTPGDRTMCRFLMGDAKHRDETLKIVPVVVVGPWIVRSAVGGKPAILGTKLPVNYVYASKEGDDQLYLEADLDIVASSAARGILSVVRSYTQSLTMDLGFVVQGNDESELPEQMLGAVRMHGIDPYSAPPLPPMKDAFDFSIGIETTGSADEVTLTPGP